MKPQCFSPAKLLTILQQQAHFGHYLVAFSGGLDSHVLLHALSQLAQEQTINVHAVHIDHGLQHLSASWAKHCQAVCQKMAIPCEVVRLTLGNSVRNNLEAQAREARYQAFAERLKPQEYLLTAHHQDDQAETVLLHLLRGSGTQGLAAMPQRRSFAQGYLCRPLLAFSRESLSGYAKEEKLNYLHDPSNDDTHFDRNFLRHNIMPRLQTHWPGVKTTLSRVARLQAEAYEIMAEQAQQDLAHCRLAQQSRMSYSLKGKMSDRLSVPCLMALSLARQKNLLYHWIKAAGFPLPSEQKIQTILSDVLLARVDATPCVQWQDTELRRYQQALYLLPQNNILNAEKQAHGELEYHWDIRFPLEIQSGIYTWHLQPEALGAYLERIKQDGRNNQVYVRFRHGGEYMQPIGVKYKRSLKKILYEAGIPPWEREHIPLIYYQKRLILVWSLCLAEM